MTVTIEATEPEPGCSPLASAALRYLVHRPTFADRAGPDSTRPFGLRAAKTAEAPVRREFRYCPDQQVAVDNQGRPLVETIGKD